MAMPEIDPLPPVAMPRLRPFGRGSAMGAFGHEQP